MDTNKFLVDKFSFSKCATISMCLRKAFYRYVMRKKEPSSPQLFFGRAVHEAMETDNYAKLNGENLHVDEVVEAGCEALKGAMKDEGSSAETAAAAVDWFHPQFERQVEVYDESGIRELIQPKRGSIEAAFQLHLQVGEPDKGMKPAVLEGYTDVVSEHVGTPGDGAVTPDAGTLVDYKTAGKPTSRAEAENHIQLTLEAVGAEVKHSQIVTFVKHKKQKPTTKITDPVAVTEKKVEAALSYVADTVNAFRAAVKTGDFPKCHPEAFYCQHGRACAFGDLCYPEKQTDLHEFVQVEKIQPVGSLPVQEWRMSAAAKKEAERTATE